MILYFVEYKDTVWFNNRKGRYEEDVRNNKVKKLKIFKINTEEPLQPIMFKHENNFAVDKEQLFKILK